MKTLTLTEYLSAIEARKRASALEGNTLEIEKCRNGGARRTASKRAILRRAEERAKAARIEPIKANY